MKAADYVRSLLAGIDIGSSIPVQRSELVLLLALMGEQE